MKIEEEDTKWILIDKIMIRIDSIQSIVQTHDGCIVSLSNSSNDIVVSKNIDYFKELFYEYLNDEIMDLNNEYTFE